MQAHEITSDAIRTQLLATLSPSHLEVIDESAAHAGHSGSNGTGHGTHFRVRITAASLTGQSRVSQHRLIYDALRQFLDAGLHALAIEVLAEPSKSIAV